MNVNEYEQVVSNQLASCQSVLNAKNAEYGSEDDRLHNFHAPAKMVGSDPRNILEGYMLKHTVSIYDMLRDIREGKDEHTMEQWNEKITDHINYLLLLKCLLVEQASKDIRIASGIMDDSDEHKGRHTK